MLCGFVEALEAYARADIENHRPTASAAPAFPTSQAKLFASLGRRVERPDAARPAEDQACGVALAGQGTVRRWAGDAPHRHPDAGRARAADRHAGSGLSVSVYVTTSTVTQEAPAGRIELKNLAAEGNPAARGGESEPAHAGGRAPRSRWTSSSRTTASPTSRRAAWRCSPRPGGLTTFRLPNQLTSASSRSADRFYVKPLLRAVTFPQAAFVLALAGGLRFAWSRSPVTVRRSRSRYPGLPTDAASAAGKASIAERSPIGRLQGSEGQKVRLRQYARKVDHALRGVLTGLEGCRLILAATEPLDGDLRLAEQLPVPRQSGRLRQVRRAPRDAERAAAARAGPRRKSTRRSCRRNSASRFEQRFSARPTSAGPHNHRAHRDPRGRRHARWSTSTRRCPATLTRSPAR